MILNYFGVWVSGNCLATSFSNNKTKFKRIDNWRTTHDVWGKGLSFKGYDRQQ